MLLTVLLIGLVAASTPRFAHPTGSEATLSYWIFQNLAPDESSDDVEYIRRGGGAVKVLSSGFKLFSYANYFGNCKPIGGVNGGALLFEGSVIVMSRNCGWDCLATYGSFVTIHTILGNVTESTYQLCGRLNSVNEQSSTSLNLGDIFFQNHNASMNFQQGIGGGFGTWKMTRLVASFCTLADDTAVSIMRTQLFEGTDQSMEYTNLLNNTVSGCLVQIDQGSFSVRNCVFRGNKGTTVAFAGAAVNLMTVTDCYIERQLVNPIPGVVYQTVDGMPSETLRIAHLDSHKCYADFPLPSVTFSADVWTEVAKTDKSKHMDSCSSCMIPLPISDS